MTKKAKQETNGKKRYNFHIQDDTMQMVRDWYQYDNCTTMNEFIEKAIEFYVGFVSNEQNRNYMPNIVIATLKSIVRDSENRYNRNLYRIALEMSMLMNIAAACHEIPKESLARLRASCEEEIKRINGPLSMETAVSWQRD